jgi:hypothetical protein
MRRQVKPDFQPMLSPGRHYMSLKEFQRKFAPPSSSQKRLSVFSDFSRLVFDLRAKKIKCELWVDGSFVTEKPDPVDIDVSLMVRKSWIDKAPICSIEFLEKLDSSTEKYLQVIDLYVSLLHDSGSELVTDEDPYSWAKQWSVEHCGYWLKGFAVVNLVDSDVGLLVCARAREGASIFR